MIRKWKKFPFSWLLPVLFFAALWLLGTTGIYNDSNQYIAMHIHREPLYSFFLWIFRSLFGETKYLDIVRFLQNGLAAFSVIWLAESLKKRFAFGQWMEALVCLILLAPHIITPVFSASGLVLSNGVISEALGLPLFYLFTAQCMKMVYTRQRGAALSSLLLSLFFSGTRTDDVHDPALAGVCRGRRDRRKKEAGETPADLCRVHCAGVWHKDASRKKLQPCF